MEETDAIFGQISHVHAFRKLRGVVVFVVHIDPDSSRVTVPATVLVDRCYRELIVGALFSVQHHSRFQTAISRVYVKPETTLARQLSEVESEGWAHLSLPGPDNL